MTKYLRALLLSCLSLLVIVSLAGLVLWKTEGLRFYSVQTASMAPILQPGDLAIATRPNPASLHIGNIISYTSTQSPSIIITHRIYQLNPQNGYLITKGDNLKYPDPPTSYSSIKGKTAKVVPKLGYISDFIHKPIGLITLIYLPGLAITSYELSRVMGHYSRQSYAKHPNGS